LAVPRAGQVSEEDATPLEHDERIGEQLLVIDERVEPPFAEQPLVRHLVGEGADQTRRLGHLVGVRADGAVPVCGQQFADSRDRRAVVIVVGPTQPRIRGGQAGHTEAWQWGERP